MSGLSVLMPVHNGERYLSEAIDSILEQTFGEFEFVIVDDGSTDGTPAMLDRYARRDARIRVIRLEKVGFVGAVNAGLEATRGELVARMDADDVALPERFETQLAYLRAHPECVLVGSRVLLIDSDGAPLREMGDRFEHDRIISGLLAGEGQLVYHPSVVFRKAAVAAVGGYRPEYPDVEDLDLFLRLAEVGRLANLPTPLLRYREHLTKNGIVASAAQDRQIDELLDEAHRRLGLRIPERKANGDRSGCSIADQHRKWAWWALHGGHTKVARKHALRSFLRSPASSKSWRVLYCAMRGR